MNDLPIFFVPAATPENIETVYSGFAKSCHVPVPPMAERIYSITFRHTGDVWTATVGKKLSGTHHVRKGSQEHLQGESDTAVVLAIFPGNPCQVFTTGGIAHRSAWANPFLAGQPDSITHFSS